MHKIHCLNNISPYGTDLLTADYELTEDAASASGILVRSAAMHDMEFGDNLLAIARAGAGVNNIPLDRCAEAGIVVFNTPGANANAVKELVLCALLLGSRGIVDGIGWVRDNADDPAVGKAAEKAKKAFAGHEIKGKKLGVIGLGAIGAEVANAAVDLGMDVYGYDPYVSVGAAWRLNSAVHYVANLDDIFRTCDYITIHVPAMESTKGMIDAHAFELMHDGVVFLNFSRDSLVNDEAMAAALESGKVGCYLTDFANPAVVAMKNAVVLPHLGASTAEAEDNCAMMAVREMMSYIETGNIANSVNFPACDMGPVPEGLRRVTVLHANVPNALTRITEIFGEAGVNIVDLTNKSRGDYAYTMLDLDAGNPGHPDDAIDRLNAIDRVFRVRVVK
ncbi:phosphoglycerate dehydrogenase [Xiamenia xianingshaonis]|uniref:D-3-phosphoglycerate dehydrogenase n=1 Tax=Xiamenia xianingshaonis TaxID=2682776 RepID=A0A9E6MQT5_9ACTN|nr:phosphoglycerate dehydrogenase [Xiamenia xianingshaonis]NGM18090.1 3-phosphoglycerate dehydrogenase [Eggerthellaceae bacterium zg-893]NHM14846.1 3-phosphoglycerate dehydrogenase [Xiamenia xianingshaonis]QTU84749.1 phosphoglycerate dehydrogenase [Xiamenia xianingshaonis]